MIQNGRMRKTVTMTFDGQALRPEEPLGLKADTRYEVTIEAVDTTDGGLEEDAWAELESLAGTIDAPEDWSREHDHYIYGVLKREC